MTFLATGDGDTIVQMGMGVGDMDGIGRMRRDK